MQLRNEHDEICHYGVLGMKWGIRKNYNNPSYSYKSRRTAKLEKKAERHAIDTPKHKKYSEQAARSKKLDASKEKYYRKTLKKKTYGARVGAATLGETASSFGAAMTGAKIAGSVAKYNVALQTGALATGHVLGLVGGVSIHDAYQVHRSFGDKAVVAAVKSIGGLGLIGSTKREHDYIYGKKEIKD